MQTTQRIVPVLLGLLVIVGYSFHSEIVTLTNAHFDVENAEQLSDDATQVIIEQDTTTDTDVDVKTVCTVAGNPRQGSIFRTNLMASLGSGDYTYDVQPSSKCNWHDRKVRMIPYVKCCTKLTSVYRRVAVSVNTYDVVIITGDEYCAVTDKRVQYRQYHGDVVGQGESIQLSPGHVVNTPLFFPLGPRFEFERVAPSDIIPPHNRKYLFNFLGSLTSQSRKVLKAVVTSDEFQNKNYPQFFHSTDVWRTSIKSTGSNGYVAPKQYREMLLDSVFTLCPIGHNPEAYRMYEACEAGSIPILVEDTSYKKAPCRTSYDPFLGPGSPMIVLSSWHDLPEFLDRVKNNATYIEEKYQQLRAWYPKYMNEMALDFERILEMRYQARMARGEPGKDKVKQIEQEDKKEESDEATESQEALASPDNQGGDNGPLTDSSNSDR